MADAWNDLLTPTDYAAMTTDLEIFTAIKEHRLAALGLPALRVIFERHELTPYLDGFLTQNSAADGPYHNLYHSVCVALNSYEGAYWEGVREPGATSLAPEPHPVRALLSAALFHDFNHSCGKRTDDWNIPVAHGGFTRLAVAPGAAPISEKELEQIISLIEVTKYPWVVEPSTLLERIIRDADLMQPYEPDDAQLTKQFLGLKVEVELQRGVKFTNAEFGAGCQEFYADKTVWYTEWARNKATALGWADKLTRLSDLLAGTDEPNDS